MMLRWRIWFTARASATKRDTISGCAEYARDSTLIATCLPIIGGTARYTLERGTATRSGTLPLVHKALAGDVVRAPVAPSVESPYGSGQFIKDLREAIGTRENVALSEIADKDGIYPSIKTFLGSGR